MLRMGNSQDNETPVYPIQAEVSHPQPKSSPVFVGPPVQQPQTAADPYGLVGLEVVVEDSFEGWSRKTIGRLRLLKYLGSGGMGAVYYSVSPVRGPLAIKILKPDIVTKFPTYVDLFSREIAAVKSLSHPHIVRFVGCGKTIQGYPFVAVEWLDGMTLDQLLNQPLSMEQILSIFEKVATALAFAHERKVIHLDVKPENVFILPPTKSGEEVVKLIDFGISRILSTYSGTTVTHFAGTLQYCSPEHFGGKVTPRSDIFSLGVMLYHLIAGKLPIGGTYIAAKQFGGPLPQLPPLPNLDKGLGTALEGVISKAIQFDPKDRFDSVNDLLISLRTAIAFKETITTDSEETRTPRLTTSKGANRKKAVRAQNAVHVCPTCNKKNRINKRRASKSQPVCGHCGADLCLQSVSSRAMSEQPTIMSEVTPTRLGKTISVPDWRQRVTASLQEILDQKVNQNRTRN